MTIHSITTSPLRVVAIAILLAIATGDRANASSTASGTDHVVAGNAQYSEGEYGSALESYERASVDMPESPLLYFNKGAALYKQERYNEAADMFRQAIAGTRDPSLAALAKYNLGNTSFREAGNQKDGDLKKALESCETSVRHYRSALEIDSEYTSAAENLEIVRLTMKSILDEINKQKEQEQQKQNESNELQDDLKELISRQNAALSKNIELSREQATNPSSADLPKKIRDLAQGQRQLHKDTEELSQKLDEMEKKQHDSAVEKAAHHAKTATEQQQLSSDKLDGQQLAGARPDQMKASNELKKALEALQNQQKDEKKEDGSEDEGEDQQGEQQDEQQPEQQPDEAEALDEQARDLIDEEEEKKEQRQRAAMRIVPVERDW